ncbi:MAG: iron ABC transporter permease [Alicyclobacillus macrosporangiidus]|uniref:FecCD family ABC transporter permease n=1 Tax=Alicyclobacillus macrosporangiidus TaxID=392015 RepID=UPI0026F23ECA|nr:iron ABC transporter permease [Alicyclobacillus macrosporangiidus]MCL6599134.1 iron ABC transporter permease [Alicyclobacillus macrosporangiidus]
MTSKRTGWVFLFLSVTLCIAAALELSLGPMTIPITRIPSAVWSYLHGARGTDEVVMGAIRLPRLLVAMLVGAGLASTGAVLQAIFRNPMADPSIIGVSSGGSLGAVLTIQFGLAQVSQWYTPLGAFASGLVVVFVVYRLSTTWGRTSIYSLLLSGVAINSFCSAIVTLVLSLAPLQTMQQMMFWLMGGLDGITWSEFLILAGLVTSGLVIYLFQAHALDLISIGEEQAEGVGVSLQHTKQITLATSAFVVGACVSATGVIGFVGLIVPHLLRLWIGPRHRNLIPASAMGGAVLMLLSDLVARMALLPVELNVGIVTSCLGAPFFLFLLRRQESRSHRG